MRKMTERNKHIGSSLDEFLEEEGSLREAKSIAIHKSAEWQLKQQGKEDERLK